MDSKVELTSAIHVDENDSEQARRLPSILKRKAVRLLVNRFPTGVEGADIMIQGGPYSASTNFGATSIGTISIRHFLWPVCYQSSPANILPAALA
ncbi:hypothetical protein [Yoonia sp. MH D7]